MKILAWKIIKKEWMKVVCNIYMYMSATLEEPLNTKADKPWFTRLLQKDWYIPMSLSEWKSYRWRMNESWKACNIRKVMVCPLSYLGVLQLSQTYICCRLVNFHSFSFTFFMIAAKLSFCNILVDQGLSAFVSTGSSAVSNLYMLQACQLSFIFVL